MKALGYILFSLMLASPVALALPFVSLTLLPILILSGVALFGLVGLMITYRVSKKPVRIIIDVGDGSRLNIAKALLEQQAETDFDENLYEVDRSLYGIPKVESKTKIPLRPLLWAMSEEGYKYIDAKTGEEECFQTGCDNFLLIDQEVYSFKLEDAKGSYYIEHGIPTSLNLKGKLLAMYELAECEVSLLSEMKKNHLYKANVEFFVSKPNQGDLYSVFIIYSGFENTSWLDELLETLKEKDRFTKDFAVKGLFLKCALALKEWETALKSYNNFELADFAIDNTTKKIKLLGTCKPDSYQVHQYKGAHINSLFGTFRQIVRVVYSEENLSGQIKIMKELLKDNEELLEEFNAYCGRDHWRVENKTTNLTLDKLIELLEAVCKDKIIAHTTRDDLKQEI